MGSSSYFKHTPALQLRFMQGLATELWFTAWGLVFTFGMSMSGAMLCYLCVCMYVRT